MLIRKQPRRMPIVALMSVLSRKQGEVEPPVWHNLLTNEEIRATLESARRAMHMLARGEEQVSPGSP